MLALSGGRKWLVLLLVILIGGGWLAYRWLLPPFRPPAVPIPNGYDDLLNAAAMIAPRTGFYRELDEEELTEIVVKNGPALKLARQGLQKESTVTLNWSADRAWFDNVHMERILSFRELGRAFAAASLQAKREGQMDEAVSFGLDMIELATAVGRGGLLIDSMMAGGVYLTAMQSLRDQVDQLSRGECVKLIAKLADSSLKLDTPEEVLRREEAFFRQIYGPVQSLMMAGVFRKQQQDAKLQMQQSKRQHQAMHDLLRIHLALRAFRLDESQLPEALVKLVPDYLAEVPQDPFGASPFVYRPKGDSYQLYSIGHNQIDDQGVESTSSVDGDLLLETIQ